MQYFPVLETTVTLDLAQPAKSKLLFYLVTRLFAQPLWRRQQENFAIEFQESGRDPDEQVPKYSDASLQVPYNQQLGQCVSGVRGGR
jgi:hypothetical protein